MARIRANNASGGGGSAEMQALGQGGTTPITFTGLEVGKEYIAVCTQQYKSTNPSITGATVTETIATSDYASQTRSYISRIVPTSTSVTFNNSSTLAITALIYIG